MYFETDAKRETAVWDHFETSFRFSFFNKKTVWTSRPRLSSSLNRHFWWLQSKRPPFETTPHFPIYSTRPGTFTYGCQERNHCFSELLDHRSLLVSAKKRWALLDGCKARDICLRPLPGHWFSSNVVQCSSNVGRISNKTEWNIDCRVCFSLSLYISPN